MGFFDDLSKKVSDTKKSFVATTEKIEKESKLKREISSNKQSIEKTYSEIGEKVYNSKGNLQEISEFIEEKTNYIDSLLKENEEKNKEILKLNNKKICPNCSTEISLDMGFCPGCGKEQEKPVAEPEVEVIPEGKVKCTGCNEVIDANIAFCPNCGAEQKKTEVAEVVETVEKVAENEPSNTEEETEEKKEETAE